MKYYEVFEGFTTLLLVDIFFCTIFIPVLGANVSAYFAEGFDLSLDCELVLTVLFSYLFASISLLIYGRLTSWKPQFSAETFQCCLLYVRDIINAVIAILSVLNIGDMIEKMVEDGAIKTPPVGKAADFVMLKFLLRQLHVEYDVLQFAQDYGFNFPPQSEDPLAIQRFEHGGEFIVSLALLACCVAKLTYYNSVFTIIRASDIIEDLKPKFNYECENIAAVQEQIVLEPSVREESVLEENFPEQTQNSERGSVFSLQPQPNQYREEGSEL